MLWLLAASYNGAGALLLVWYALTINVAEAHPVALALAQRGLALVIAAVVAVNAWKLAHGSNGPKLSRRAKTWFLLLGAGFLAVEVAGRILAHFSLFGAAAAVLFIYLLGWTWISSLVAGRLTRRYAAPEHALPREPGQPG